MATSGAPPLAQGCGLTFSGHRWQERIRSNEGEALAEGDPPGTVVKQLTACNSQRCLCRSNSTRLCAPPHVDRPHQDVASLAATSDRVRLTHQRPPRRLTPLHHPLTAPSSPMLTPRCSCPFQQLSQPYTTALPYPQSFGCPTQCRNCLTCWFSATSWAPCLLPHHNHLHFTHSKFAEGSYHPTCISYS